MTTIVWESKDGPRRLDITPYHEGTRGEAGLKKEKTSQYDSKTSLSVTPALDTTPIMLPTSATIVNPFSATSSTSTSTGTIDTFTLPKTTAPSSTITLKPSSDTASSSLQATPYAHTEVKLTINLILPGPSDSGASSTSGRAEFSDSGILGTTTPQNLTLVVEIPPIVNLYSAIFSNNIGAVEKILQSSSNLAGLPDSSGRTLLHLAVDIGNKDIVKAMLRNMNPKDISKQDSQGYSPLHLAIGKGNSEISGLLIDSMKTEDIASVKTKEWQYTPLHMALRSNADPEEIAKIALPILDKAPKIASATDKANQTALHLAADKGSEDVVTKLLEVMKDDKDIEKADEGWQGYTALHLAVQGGYYNIVDKMLKRDPKLAGIPDKYGQTPLHWAVTNGNKQIIEALVKVMSEIDLFKRSEAGYIALSFAKDQELQKWIIDIIKKKEIDIHTEGEKITDFLTTSFSSLLDTSGSIENPELEKIAEAIDTEDSELVSKEIQELGDKLSVTDKIFGKTLLHLAVKSGNEKIIEQLFKALKPGTPLAKIKDINGDTILHTALIHSHEEVAKLIIEKTKGEEGFINLTNNEGRTALHLVGNTKMAQHLIASGATIGNTDKDGRTVLSSAAADGDIEMLKLFLDRVDIDITTIRSAVRRLVYDQENIPDSIKVLKILKDKLASTSQGKSKLSSYISTIKKEFGEKEDFSLASEVLGDDQDTGVRSLGAVEEE